MNVSVCLSVCLCLVDVVVSLFFVYVFVLYNVETYPSLCVVVYVSLCVYAEVWSHVNVCGLSWCVLAVWVCVLLSFAVVCGCCVSCQEKHYVSVYCIVHVYAYVYDCVSIYTKCMFKCPVYGYVHAHVSAHEQHTHTHTHIYIHIYKKTCTYTYTYTFCKCKCKCECKCKCKCKCKMETGAQREMKKQEKWKADYSLQSGPFW